MSYHLSKIKKGVLGETSKIQEELDEVIDAEQQNCKIMIGCELSDLYGAIESYASKFDLTMDDLSIMNEATKRAFESGRRVSEEETTEQYNTIKVNVTSSFIEDNFNLCIGADNSFYILYSKKSKINIIVPIKNSVNIIIDGAKNYNLIKDSFVTTEEIESNINEFISFDNCLSKKLNFEVGEVYIISFDNWCDHIVENIIYKDLEESFGFILDHINSNSFILNSVMKASNLW